MSSVPAGASPAAPQAVAFCPSPPLLVPAVAGRAAEGTAALRAACASALDAALAIRPEVVVVVGGEGGGGRFGDGDGGDLRGFGVDLEVPFAGRARPGGRRTPLAHTIGAWLLDEAGYAGVRIGIGPDDLTGTLSGLPGPIALLAMGDGSARRSLKAPGHLHEGAEPFDDAVAAALAAGDAGGLAGLDPAEGARLLAAGVPTWRAVGAALCDREVSGRLHAHEAPFGVGYLVADWSVR